jgi:glyoxylase-like metal-dependent hydrolase (beta-lactamase superfamily II)
MSSKASPTTEPSVRIGDVTVTAFVDVDVDFKLGLDQVFPGIDPESWEPFRRRYPQAFAADGGWRYMVTCYLVRMPGWSVLIDTGCGAPSLAFPGFLEAGGALRERLGACGVRPEDVDVVVITHAHPDHVGGVLDEADPAAPAFPRARYLLSRTDWETWRRKDVQDAFPFPYIGDTLEPLVNLGVVDLVDGERSVGRGLTLLPTPGHTPGHYSVLITSGRETALIAGDPWLHPAQVTEPGWESAFDMDAAQAVRTRSALTERIAAEGMTVGATHFPDPFGQIVRLERRYHWMPLPASALTGG